MNLSTGDPTLNQNNSNNSDGKLRLSKLMSERGLCSRREADELIRKGWVFVNGVRVNELGYRVTPDVEIELSGQAQENQQKLVTIILNKPIGYVSSQPEPQYEPAVRLLTAENHDLNDSIKRPLTKKDFVGLAVTGRLDIDSQGLLIFTQDGRLAKKLIGQDSEIEKEYLVRVQGSLSKNDLQLLCHGMELDGKALKPAVVEWINQDQLRFILKEGKKRQIRRMCELVGLQVIGLKRVRVGNVRLGKLAEGQWRYLRSDENF